MYVSYIYLQSSKGTYVNYTRVIGTQELTANDLINIGGRRASHMMLKQCGEIGVFLRMIHIAYTHNRRVSSATARSMPTIVAPTELIVPTADAMVPTYELFVPTDDAVVPTGAEDGYCYY